MKKIIDSELYCDIYDYIKQDWDEYHNTQADELLTALDNAPEVEE